MAMQERPVIYSKEGRENFDEIFRKKQPVTSTGNIASGAAVLDTQIQCAIISLSANESYSPALSSLS